MSEPELREEAINEPLIVGSTTNTVVRCRDIRRYEPNEQYFLLFGIPVGEEEAAFAYDVDFEEIESAIVSHEGAANTETGTHIRKQTVLLHPRLSALVENGALHAGASVSITRSREIFNETTAEARKVICVEELAVAGAQGSDFIMSSNISEEDFDATNVAFSPLMGKNGIYLCHDDEDVHSGGRRWRSRDLSLPEGEPATFPRKLKTAVDMFSERSGSRNLNLSAEAKETLETEGREPYLMGVVEKKSRLSYSHNSKANLPLQFWFYIKDESASVKVVVWGAACHRFYKSVAVGSIVVVMGFRIRVAAFPNASGVEISVNRTNPEGRIILIDKSLARPVNGLRLSQLLDAAPFNAIAKRPDGTRTTLRGVVTCVGKVLRRRLAANSVKRGQFPLYRFRWVWLTDSRTHIPIPVLLYSSVSRDVFDGLKAALGLPLIVTDAEVRSLTTDSIAPRRIFLECTNESSIVWSRAASSESERGGGGGGGGGGIGGLEMEENDPLADLSIEDLVRRHGFTYTPSYGSIEEALEGGRGSGRGGVQSEFLPLALIHSTFAQMADRELLEVFVHTRIRAISIASGHYKAFEELGAGSTDVEEEVEEHAHRKKKRKGRKKRSKDKAKGKSKHKRRKRAAEETEEEIEAAEAKEDEDADIIESTLELETDSQNLSQATSSREVDSVPNTQTEVEDELEEAIDSSNASIVFTVEDLTGKLYGEIVAYSKYSDGSNFGTIFTRLLPPRVLLVTTMLELRAAASLEEVVELLTPALVGREFTMLVGLCRRMDKALIQCLRCFEPYKATPAGEEG